MTAKTTVKGIKGKTQLAHAVYDYSVDAGAIGTVDLFSIPANSIVHDFWFEVETALTSSGLATVEVGITGGDTDGFITQAAFSDWTLDLVSAKSVRGALLHDGTAKDSLRYKTSAAVTVALKIATAALTAGKVHFYVEFSDGY
jgi:hypothetical protein